MSEQAAVQASNKALRDNVTKYGIDKSLLEGDMHDRRELYASIFGPPLKPPPPAGRKGKLRRSLRPYHF